MHSKAMFLLLVCAIAIAVVSAYDEDELFDQFMVQNMLEKRGKGKGKGKGKSPKTTYQGKFKEKTDFVHIFRKVI